MTVHCGLQNKSHKNIFQTACDCTYVWRKIQVLECLNWKEAFSETWNQFGAEMLPFLQKRRTGILDRKTVWLFLMRRVFFFFVCSDLDCWTVWLENGDASHYGSRTRRLLKSPVLSAHYRDCLIKPDLPKHSELTAAHKGLWGKNSGHTSCIWKQVKVPRVLLYPWSHRPNDPISCSTATHLFDIRNSHESLISWCLNASPSQGSILFLCLK